MVSGMHQTVQKVDRSEVCTTQGHMTIHAYHRRLGSKQVEFGSGALVPGSVAIGFRGWNRLLGLPPSSEGYQSRLVSLR